MFGWFKRDTSVDDAIFEYEWKKADERRKADGIVIVERANGTFKTDFEYDVVPKPSSILSSSFATLKQAQEAIIEHYRFIDEHKPVRRY